jgi:hypothetical protein
MLMSAKIQVAGIFHFSEARWISGPRFCQLDST